MHTSSSPLPRCTPPPLSFLDAHLLLSPNEMHTSFSPLPRCTPPPLPYLVHTSSSPLPRCTPPPLPYLDAHLLINRNLLTPICLGVHSQKHSEFFFVPILLCLSCEKAAIAQITLIFLSVFLLLPILFTFFTLHSSLPILFLLHEHYNRSFFLSDFLLYHDSDFWYYRSLLFYWKIQKIRTN